MLRPGWKSTDAAFELLHSVSNGGIVISDRKDNSNAEGYLGAGVEAGVDLLPGGPTLGMHRTSKAETKSSQSNIEGQPADTEIDESEDEDVGDEGGDHECPICGGDQWDSHLVATFENGEGIVDGSLKSAADRWIKDIWSGIQLALIKNQPDNRWPDEVRSLFTELMPYRENSFVPNGDENYGEQQVMDDCWFHDAWIHVSADELLRNHLFEWLDGQDGMICTSYEIDSAPGMSWSGSHFHAAEPQRIEQRFKLRFT